MKAIQAVIVEPYKTDIREVELPDPGPDQFMVATKVSAISAGTELAVYTGGHQWLKDPNMPDWKFPFKPGYSAAGTVVKVGKEVVGLKEGDRVSFPGNHASLELLSTKHERGKWWKLPENLDFDKASVACISRYGMGASIRAGLTLGRSACVLGLGIIGQFSLRCLIAAGANPVIGIDAVPMRRNAALAAGADAVIDPANGPSKEQLRKILPLGAEIVVDATGIPDAVPQAMSLACDAGQVIVVGSPRGKATDVNFYDDLHRRYIEVCGAHGNMLFEPAHIRLNGNWNIHKAQNWLLASLASGRLSLSGLITHKIKATELTSAYDGLLKNKDEYLGVTVHW